MNELIQIHNLCFQYNEYDSRTNLAKEGSNGIENIELSIPEGSFVTLCGASGSGKSTLLKLLKRDIITSGKLSGKIIFDGKNINDIPAKELASSIGLLFQNPEDQIVTDKVWHEIAFGLENIGMAQSEIEARLAEAFAFFRLESIGQHENAHLSGGQKQLVSLASVLSMYPRLLLLDEPTSQLDPEAAEHYISTIKKLQSSLGLTVIIAEHNLERLLPISDMLIVMEKGKIICCDTTENALHTLSYSNLPDLPLPARFGMKIDSPNIPLDITHGRKLLADYVRNNDIPGKHIASEINSSDDISPSKLLSLTDISFRYTKSGNDVINELCASFNKGSIYAVLGCNASGKSTLLNILSGSLKPQLGHFSPKLSKLKVTYLPQDTDNIFIADTIEKELSLVGLTKENFPEYICHIDSAHGPLELSGGEKQLVALAKVSACKPDLLLLDEPTKGTDNLSKQKMINALLALKNEGTTIIMACHDMNFAAECADWCSILSMGKLTIFQKCSDFFTSHQLYTTPARAMSRGIIDNLFLDSDIMLL